MSSETDRFETEVRRMLQRRAADIRDVNANGRKPASPAAVVDPASARRRFPSSRILVAAAVGMLLIAGAAAVNARFGVRTDAVEAVSGINEPSTTSSTEVAETTGSAEPQPQRGALSTEQALASALVALPPGFDPVSGRLVDTQWSTSDPDHSADQFLTARLPAAVATGSASVELAPVGQTNGVWIHRWDIGEAGGWLLQRDDRGFPALVALTVDGIKFVSIERSVENLNVGVLIEQPEGATVSVQTLDGVPTAESQIIQTGTQTIDYPVGWEIVTVVGEFDDGPRAEFAVDSVGFTQQCGPNPPISIDIGTQVGPLESGPLPSDGRPALENQQVWHHPGDSASLEIRWPPTPLLLAGIGPDYWDPSPSFSLVPPGLDQPDQTGPHEGEGTAVLYLGPDPTDPCSTVEIHVSGDAETAEWWSSALSSEWNFDYPLSIADLDPEELAALNAPVDFEETFEVVAGRQEMAAVPTIPATGSCDGLPDAPPQTGEGSPLTYASAEEALLAFLNERSHGDPPISTTGYTEIVVDGQTTAYAMLYDDLAYTVITVAENDEGWVVLGWSGAAC